jgi:hypothetical protein
MVRFAMATMIRFVRKAARRRRRQAPGCALYTVPPILIRLLAKKEKTARRSAQPFEKARSGQENQRKSKPIPLISFAEFGPGLAGFG